MKRICVLCLSLLLAAPVLAADTITSLVYHDAGSEKLGADPYLSGDLWIRVHEPKRAKLDFDLQFERSSSKLNIAQIKLLLPGSDVIIGRQQIGWGVGYAVNPVDIINPRPIGSSFDRIEGEILETISLFLFAFRLYGLGVIEMVTFSPGGRGNRFTLYPDGYI